MIQGIALEQYKAGARRVVCGCSAEAPAQEVTQLPYAGADFFRLSEADNFIADQRPILAVEQIREGAVFQCIAGIVEGLTSHGVSLFCCGTNCNPY